MGCRLWGRDGFLIEWRWWLLRALGGTFGSGGTGKAVEVVPKHELKRLNLKWIVPKHRNAVVTDEMMMGFFLVDFTSVAWHGEQINIDCHSNLFLLPGLKFIFDPILSREKTHTRSVSLGFFFLLSSCCIFVYGDFFFLLGENCCLSRL